MKEKILSMEILYFICYTEYFYLLVFAGVGFVTGDLFVRPRRLPAFFGIVCGSGFVAVFEALIGEFTFLELDEDCAESVLFLLSMGIFGKARDGGGAFAGLAEIFWFCKSQLNFLVEIFILWQSNQTYLQSFLDFCQFFR